MMVALFLALDSENVGNWNYDDDYYYCCYDNCLCQSWYHCWDDQRLVGLLGLGWWEGIGGLSDDGSLG